MSPYPIAPPPEEQALATAVEEQSKTEQADQATAARPARPELPRLEGPIIPPSRKNGAAAYAERALFSDSLLDLSATRPQRRTLDFVLSVVVHAVCLTIVVLIPLFYTEAIDLRQFTQTFLVAPPPPPPPPPPAAPAVAKITAAPRRVFTASGKLVAPTVIPEKIAMLKEEELPPDVGLGVVGGVPGGVPGGQAGGVIGGIISSAPRTFIPIAPTTKPKAPVRVGGRVKAPRPLSTPEPLYPILAKQAKVQGDVLIDAVIDTSGNVVEMRVVSGHPLLIPAATEALRKWRYEPTYLNEEPVSVQLLVTIKFRLQ